MSRLKRLVEDLKQKEFELSHLENRILERISKEGELIEGNVSINVFTHKVPVTSDLFTNERLIHLYRMKVGRSFVKKNLRVDDDAVTKILNKDLLIDKETLSMTYPALQKYISDSPQFELVTEGLITPVYDPEQSLSVLRKDLLLEIKELSKEIKDEWTKIKSLFHENSDHLHDGMVLTQSVSFSSGLSLEKFPDLPDILGVEEYEVSCFRSSATNRSIGKLDSLKVPIETKFYLLARIGKAFYWGSLLN